MRNYDPSSPLIFLHIPKTAGTFFRDIIAREYPRFHFPKTISSFFQSILTKEYSSRQCLYLYYPMPYGTDLINELKKEVNNKRAIYGHVSYGIHQVLDIPPQYVTILRHPLERVVSFYLHNAKYTQAPYYSDIQAGMSLLEMLESGMTHEVNNHLTRIIAHEPFAGKLEDFTVLDRALTHLERDFCFVGLTEKLDTSINALSKKLAWRYPHSVPSSASKTQQYLNQLDKKTLTALKDYNHLDLLLYDYATRLFHHEVKMIMSPAASPEETLTEANFDNEYYFSLYPDIASHPAYQGIANGGWLHWVKYGKYEGRNARAIGQTSPVTTNNKAPAPSLAHRVKGYKLLTGHGLEIGALHQPAQIPKHCKIEYCDAAPREELVKFFQELNVNDLVKVDHICDLDTQALSIFDTDQYDFVIINHVIEHVANPIKVIEELFRIIKPQGKLIISAPDKNYTFDKQRALTSFEHLLGEYQQNTTTVTDDHYLDFLKAVHPELMSSSSENLAGHIENVRNRREHAHVWNSDSFEVFMDKTLIYLNINAKCLFLHKAEDNNFEYFAVWEKS